MRDRSTEIYLVLRVEKVLTGDIKDALEPYFKHASVRLAALSPPVCVLMARIFVQLKPKALSKFSKELEAACELTSQWSQPFGWSAYPLFDEKGTLRIGVDVCIPQCADCVWFSLLAHFHSLF